MMIYGPFADEDILLLSSIDVPNEIPGYQLPNFINIDLFGQRILGMIGIRDFSLPWNIDGPIYNPSHCPDENFGRRSLTENSSIHGITMRLENFADFQKSKVTPTQQGSKVEDETNTRLDINYVLPQDS
jgi:hypothetical protein